MAQRGRSRARANSTKSAVSSAVAAGDANPFGGINEDDVRTFATSYLGEVPELAAPEFSIALESVARAVAARMDHDDYAADEKRLAFFIITDRARVLGERIGAIGEPIVDNGSKRL